MSNLTILIEYNNKKYKKCLTMKHTDIIINNIR